MCSPKIETDIKRAIKAINQLETQFEESSNSNVKMKACVEITRILKRLIMDYSSKGIPTFLPEPAEMLSDYQKKLGKFSELVLEANDISDGVKWCSAPGDKTCNVCSNRNEKTAEEIKRLNDGFPIKIPCHEGCRCQWLPNLKSDKELMGKYYGENMKKLQGKDMADYELNYYKPKSQDVD